MKPDIIALFIERFPRYTFALRNWVPSAEKAPVPDLKNLPLETAQILYLYGLDGKTALSLLPWLSEKASRRLIFLEPDTGEIAAFLKEESALEVLSQKQIEIYHLPKRKEKNALIVELSQKYSYKAVFVSYVKGHRGEFTRLKIDLLRETAVAYLFHIELMSSPALLSNLKKNSAALSSSFCVEGLKDAFGSVPAIICGAGPSLQRSIETLKKLRGRALIFAGGSAIAALSHHGIEPHFAIAVDPNDEEFDRLKNSLAFQAPFLFNLRLNPSCLSVTNGPLGYVRSTRSGTIPLWLENEMKLPAPSIGKILPPRSYSVTMVSAAIAYHFGCNPILFEGIDLAYTENRRYAEGVEAKEDAELLQPFDRPLSKQSKGGKKISSAVRWVMEADALSKLAKHNQDRRWVQCTADGLALKHLESMPLSVAADLFPEERDLAGLVHQKILSSPLPEEIPTLYTQTLKELENSLDRVLEHLDVLIKNTPGRAILSEIELKDEPIYRLIFHNTVKTFSVLFPDKTEKRDYWTALQILALECKKALS